MLLKDIPSDVAPQKGDIVTFTYTKIAQQIGSINAKILRIRADIKWEDVLLDYAKDRKLNGKLVKVKEIRCLLNFYSRVLAGWLCEEANELLVFRKWKEYAHFV